MSTRSFICIKQKDKSLKGVYCHWDGYLECNGALLIDHYRDREKVEKLISLGDLSSLGAEIEPDAGREHNFCNSQEGVCVFYGRDRGEQNTEAKKITLNAAKKSWADYMYVFGLDNKWRYCELCDDNPQFKLVEEGLDELFKEFGFRRPIGYYGFYTKELIEKFKLAEKGSKAWEDSNGIEQST